MEVPSGLAKPGQTKKANTTSAGQTGSDPSNATHGMTRNSSSADAGTNYTRAGPGAPKTGDDTGDGVPDPTERPGGDTGSSSGDGGGGGDGGGDSTVVVVVVVLALLGCAVFGAGLFVMQRNASEETAQAKAARGGRRGNKQALPGDKQAVQNDAFDASAVFDDPDYNYHDMLAQDDADYHEAVAPAGADYLVPVTSDPEDASSHVYADVNTGAGTHGGAFDAMQS